MAKLTRALGKEARGECHLEAVEGDLIWTCNRSAAHPHEKPDQRSHSEEADEEAEEEDAEEEEAR
eukprot:3956641-Alexandrium_andersonii.AAC.1